MNQIQLPFGEAVKRALTVNYCNFAGRASRSEYWWFCLFSVIASAVLGIVFCWSDIISAIVRGLFSLGILLPSLGLAIRRMHDVGRSGWWFLINLIPIVGAIIFIVFACGESKNTPNKWGPVPNLVEQ